MNFTESSNDNLTDSNTQTMPMAILAQNVSPDPKLSAQYLADSPAAHKTRAALLTLGDVMNDQSAATALWTENREAIELEMILHLRNCSDAHLRASVLEGLAMQARFFCNELDEPQEWVARCANLEARRAALQLRK